MRNYDYITILQLIFEESENNRHRDPVLPTMCDEKKVKLRLT